MTELEVAAAHVMPLPDALAPNVSWPTLPLLAAVQTQVNWATRPAVTVCEAGLGLPHVADAPFVPMMVSAEGETFATSRVAVRLIVTVTPWPAAANKGVTLRLLPVFAAAGQV
jgi:hypothetical protein